MSVPKVLFTQDTGAQSSKNGKKRNNIRVYECGYMIATKIKNQCFLIVFQTEWPWSTSSCQYTEKQCPTTTWEKNKKYCFKAFEANNVTSLFTPQKLVDSCKVNIPQMFI